MSVWAGWGRTHGVGRCCPLSPNLRAVGPQLRGEPVAPPSPLLAFPHGKPTWGRERTWTWDLAGCLEESRDPAMSRALSPD